MGTLQASSQAWEDLMAEYIGGQQSTILVQAGQAYQGRNSVHTLWAQVPVVQGSDPARREWV